MSPAKIAAAAAIYDAKTFQPKSCVGRLLTHVKMSMSEALDEELAPLGITAAQFVILVMLALIAVTTTIILFAIPPLSRQLQELVHSTPNMWQGIRTRIESLTKNYPEVRE